jgi:CheY-like chemotaxis protein/anti-sigma regulatory factor (Ser/Thr protein kinase)
MTTRNPVILIVDDTPLIQLLISKYLEGCGYTLDFANDGEIACQKLFANPDLYDAVLLDRMMPNVDGMEVLRRIRQDDRFKLLPVILQTAMSSAEDFAEGLNAGAYYYLSKPLQKSSVRAVLSSALRERLGRLSDEETFKFRKQALESLEVAQFTFRTIDSANHIAELISSLCPSPETVRMGVLELMINAVEHGNLGISYDEKGQLISDEQLTAEIERRLKLPEYANRQAILKFDRQKEKIVFTIQDEGIGFDPEPYMEIRTERIMDNHGRGIAISCKLAFSELLYLGNGNCVQATINMPV